MLHANVAPESCPALVLNADYRPLSYYPLSLWCWQDVVKAVFLDRVDIVSEYDTMVRSPSFEFRLPSVVSLKSYVKPARHPAFTRQYCGQGEDLTFDHVVPRSKGGQTTWDNVITACSPCNLRKGNKMPRDCGMHPASQPIKPGSMGRPVTEPLIPLALSGFLPPKSCSFCHVSSAN